jgi:hypothetical protein
MRELTMVVISRCLCGRYGVRPWLPSTSSLDVAFPFTGYVNVGTMLVVSLYCHGHRI